MPRSNPAEDLRKAASRIRENHGHGDPLYAFWLNTAHGYDLAAERHENGRRAEGLDAFEWDATVGAARAYLEGGIR